MQLEFIIIGQTSRATICHCPENLMDFGRACHKVFVVLRSGGQVTDFAKGQFRCCCTLHSLVPAAVSFTASGGECWEWAVTICRTVCFRLLPLLLSDRSW